MTLGYSWQEIGHATLRSGVTIYVDAKLISQSIPNNSSTLSMRLEVVENGGTQQVVLQDLQVLGLIQEVVLLILIEYTKEIQYLK